VSLEIACDASLVVACDRNRMEIALGNLIANAVKFVQAGGAVSVSASADSGRARFVVRDNGPGIAPEDLPLVFERFHRGRNATAEGAGLGCAIALSIARAHGGTIQAESIVGQGSAFTMEIPLGV
jgi:two-component system, OmpR family, sensor histidine kinase BaeS